MGRIAVRNSLNKMCSNLNERRRLRYKTDPKYRKRCINASKKFRIRNPKICKQYRLRVYWKHPDLHRRQSSKWYHTNRQKCLRRDAKRRRKRRLVNRARAARQSLLLTDSYVRNQLSKYSVFGTLHWTPQQVHDKRQKMIIARAKRITPWKVAAIRKLWNDESNTLSSISKRFGVSQGSVWLIVRNKLHVDPKYAPKRIASIRNVSSVLKMINTASQLLKA